MKILGISCFYHDSAAVLLIDGKVVAASEEERFSRIKHDSGFPKHAIDFCLQSAGVKSDTLDYVIFYEKPFVKFERITLSHLQTAPLARSSFVSAYTSWLSDKLWIKETLRKELHIESSKILFCDHHVSHAAASFFTSGFDKSAILTIDGVGEWNTTAWGTGENGRLKLNKRITFPHSLGLFYSTITQFLGFAVNEGEFKVMGLAPYGKPTFKNKIKKIIKQNRDGAFTLDMKYFEFHKSEKISFSKDFISLLGVKERDTSKSEEVLDVYADIAASAQEVLDDCVVSVADHIYKKTKLENLCYGGGVALNGVTNWEILKNTGFKHLHVHPAAGDSGGALGAALFLNNQILKAKNQDITSMYLGYENTQKDIQSFIKKNKLKAKRLSDKSLISEVAKLLTQEKVVGWVRGRTEWGPRALGARSILADPRSVKMKEVVNSKIKFREGFRPFAPVCPIEMSDKYFEFAKIKMQEPLEYMIAVIPVKKSQQKNLGAITHVDGTARPQFIKRDKNPVYYDLICQFGKLTGVSVLLNTSFNLKGEPIVNSCEDAWNTFQKSGLDALVLGNYLIKK